MTAAKNMALNPSAWPVRKLETDQQIQEFRTYVAELDLLTEPGGELEVKEADRRLIAAFRNGPVLITNGQRYTPAVKAVLDLAIRKSSPLSEEIYMAPEATVREIYSERLQVVEDPATQANEQARQTELRLLISRAARAGASDIHIRILQSHTEIRVRVNGRMRDIDISTEDGGALVRAALAVASDQNTRGSELTAQQGALTKKSQLLPPNVDLIRLQYSPTSEQRGALVMRLKYQSSGAKTNIEELGYSKDHVRDLQLMRRRTNGLYLFSGKVSSGKSTTLERAMNAMYSEKNKEITTYTIEEPVELQIPGAIQVAVQSSDEKDRREKMTDAMRGALRSDPNVIVVGELRDEGTADLALHAAQTGHALWSTVHAGTALGILDRLESLGVDRWKIADPSIVRGLLYQRLVGVLCEHCKLDFNEAVKARQIERDLAHQVMRVTGRGAKELFVRHPRGCAHCDLGLVGRTVVAETIVTDATLLDLYFQGNRAEMRAYWTRPKARKEDDLPGMGGTPVLHHALVKVGAGLIDPNEVEEEVDLVEVYEREYGHLKPRLQAEIAEMRGEPARAPASAAAKNPEAEHERA